MIWVFLGVLLVFVAFAARKVKQQLARDARRAGIEAAVHMFARDVDSVFYEHRLQRIAYLCEEDRLDEAEEQLALLPKPLSGRHESQP